MFKHGMNNEYSSSFNRGGTALKRTQCNTADKEKEEYWYAGSDKERDQRPEEEVGRRCFLLRF